VDNPGTDWRILGGKLGVKPVVMCVICMVMSALMYLPFLRAYERSLMKTEEQKKQNSAPMAETVGSN
jgi:PTS system cellobiose-specific IIC component